jgi:hypothetical protein
MHTDHATFPQLPLKTDVLSAALKSAGLQKTIGHSPYSARRACACAIAQLIQTEEGKNVKNVLGDDRNFKTRANAQFGWCPKSTMLLHYSNNHHALNSLERSFWFPLYRFLRYGQTQSALGRPFIISGSGATMPPPQPSSSTPSLIGPATYSDTTNVDVAKIIPNKKSAQWTKKNFAIATQGASIVTSGAHSASSSTAPPIVKGASGDVGAKSGRQFAKAKGTSSDVKSNRGRKAGGKNRPKDIITAEKILKATRKTNAKERA